MSNQYQQPYGQPHQTYPGGPGYPPPSKKKKMSGGAIVAIVIGCVLGGLFLLLLIIGFAVSDDSSPSEDKASVLEVTASPSESAAEAPAKPAEKTPEKAAEPKKATEYPSGDYVVGEDIPAGTYTSAGAEKGIFELCTITTEPTGDTTMPKIKTSNADERIIITLEKADGVVSISGCEPLKPRE
ncbi:hypothetical protein ABTX84_19170 [Streptomyces sp. NPDC095614]|uniref:hypothetical protein n=1 Tax=Streptomyces sp. NPDC095614 TaxID=3156692 RepID=UPI003328A152